MEIVKSEPHVSVAAGTVYQTVTVTDQGTCYSFTRATGRNNYIAVCKESANPYMRTGKQFKSFDEAHGAYRQPLIKTMILLAEVEFNKN